MNKLIEQLNKMLENYNGLRQIRAATLFVDHGFNTNIDNVLSNIEKSIDYICNEMKTLSDKEKVADLEMLEIFKKYIHFTYLESDGVIIKREITLKNMSIEDGDAVEKWFYKLKQDVS